MEFTHLHVHSDYSLLDGYGTLSEYVNKAVELGQSALALTDHNSMAGIYKFIKLCNKNGIKPIAGLELNLAPKHPDGAKNKGYVKYDDKQFILGRGSHTHLTLLAKNNEGLKNLYRLVYESYHPENYFNVPRVDLSILKKYSSGLICLSGCPNSEINVRLRLGQHKEALTEAATLKEMFGDDFYIEVMDYKTSPGYSVDKLSALANKLNLKMVLTNDVHYVVPEHAEMQEKHLAIGNKNKMNETPTFKGGFRLALGGKNRYLKSAEEMSIVLPDDKYNEAFHNTQEIVDKIEDITIEYDPTLKAKIDIPKNFKSRLEYLKYLILEGYKRKRVNRGASEEVLKESQERVREELEVIVSNDYVDYFLVVWDYLKWTRENGWGQCTGRGSVGGSEIAFLLDISNTDPIRFGLLFERFISPGRGATYLLEYDDGTQERINIAEKKIVNGKNKYIHQLKVGDIINEKTLVHTAIVDPGSPPDIDSDFHTIGREHTINYVREKYGVDNVAAIATPGPFKNKNAWKSICTIDEIPFAQANALSNYIPEGDNLQELLNVDNSDGTELRNALKDEKTKKAAEDASELIGRMRESGVHACGIIISSKNLQDITPLTMRQSDGKTITQWNNADCEEMGLLKMDFLGLDTMDLLLNTVENIKYTKGIEIDLDEIVHGPLDDKKTFELFQKGETEAIFQFASEGVKAVLKKVKPTEFEDISAITALYRPGPMGLNLHNDFAKRKNDPKARVPVHENFYGTELEEVLKPTLGALIYQESVMQVAKRCAGFTAQEADTLRKAIGKKKMDLLMSLENKFKEGMEKNGYGKEEVDFLWDGIIAFGSYAFNKSHACSYALNSYQAAYLKAHYPVEFMAAVLQQRVNDDKISSLYSETKRLGIKIQHPSVNTSSTLIQPSKDGKSIVYGLSSIKTINTDIVKSIIEERTLNGEYSSILDFVSRNKDIVKASTVRGFAKAGALDCFGIPRKQLFDNADSIVAKVGKIKEMSKEINMFDLLGGPKVEDTALSFSDEEWSFPEYAKNEAEMTEMYISCHPIDHITQDLIDLSQGLVDGENYVSFSKVKLVTPKNGSSQYRMVANNGISEREIRVPKNMMFRFTKYELEKDFGKSKAELIVASDTENKKYPKYFRDNYKNIRPLSPLKEHTVYKIELKTRKLKTGESIVFLNSLEEVDLNYKGELVIRVPAKYKDKIDYYRKKILNQGSGECTITLQFPDGTSVDIENANYGNYFFEIGKIEEEIEKEQRGA